ncbi:MAG: septum formation initiator [Desulfuromonas sp.]|nr:MAG: septum formation initiator [Desulfuromonas sp.]
MSEEKHENTPDKRYRLPRWWGVLLFLLIGFALFGENGLLRLYRSYQFATTLEAEVAALQEKNRQLEHEIRMLREDPDYIERIARERLGMVRKDEVVYQFQETRPDVAVPENNIPSSDY